MIFEIDDLMSRQETLTNKEILIGFAESLTLAVSDYH